jgi:hypothetical protein
MERVARNPLAPQVRQFADPNICPLEQEVYSMAHLLRAIMKTLGRTDAACQREKIMLIQRQGAAQEYADLYQEFYIDYRHTT